MKDRARDQLRKTILEAVKEGPLNYTRIEKKVVGSSMLFATSNTFKTQFYKYLLPNGYLKRVSQGVFEITEKGRNLLVLLS